MTTLENKSRFDLLKVEYKGEIRYYPVGLITSSICLKSLSDQYTETKDCNDGVYLHIESKTPLSSWNDVMILLSNQNVQQCSCESVLDTLLLLHEYQFSVNDQKVIKYIKRAKNNNLFDFSSLNHLNDDFTYHPHACFVLFLIGNLEDVLKYHKACQILILRTMNPRETVMEKKFFYARKFINHHHNFNMNIHIKKKHN